MGVSVSTQVIDKHITNDIRQIFETGAYSSAEANCKIRIGSISIGESENCSVEIINRCNSNATNTMESIISVVQRAISNMNESQKQVAAQTLASISVNSSVNTLNLSNSFETYVKNQCSSESESNNTIRVDNITIGKCKSSGNNVVLKFINTGQARANCAMNIVTNLIGETLSTTETVQDQETTAGLDVGGIIGNVYTQFSTIIIVGIIILGLFFIARMFLGNRGGGNYRGGYAGGVDDGIGRDEGDITDRDLQRKGGGQFSKMFSWESIRHFLFGTTIRGPTSRILGFGDAYQEPVNKEDMAMALSDVPHWSYLSQRYM